jgi:hypothetical protein
MFLVLLTATLIQAAPVLSAKLDRNVVSVGESVTLSLTFEGASPSGGAPVLPALSNLRFTGNISQSQQIGIANGLQSLVFTYHYVLIATQAGDVTIPSLSASAGGATLTSQPVALRILPAGAAGANPDAMATNFAFIRIVVPKTEVYVGETFPVDVQLFYRQADDPRQFPQLKAEGFSVGQWPQPKRAQTQVGNAVFNVYVFKISATAARAGALILGPAETTLNLLIPSGRRQRNVFDLFDSGYERRPATLTSDTIQLSVLPLPKTDVPADFSGAIGHYALRMTASPTNVAVGDPITVRVQIAGRGAFDSLNLPLQTGWREFNTYPPTAKFEPTDELGLEGTKSFEQVVIPLNQEIKTLPPLQFSFFDPGQRKYVTLVGPTLPLLVRPSATSVQPPPSLTNATDTAMPQPADDIIHIKPRLELAAAAPLLVARPWFLALQAAPALVWLSLRIQRQRSEALANNPKLRRRREVAAKVRDGLKELRAHAEAHHSDDFFATLFRLLQEQLGERLDLPASAITEAIIEDRLRPRVASESTLKSLHDLFQSCNLARYAPAQSSQELTALIPKLESALRDLQTLKP